MKNTQWFKTDIKIIEDYYQSVSGNEILKGTYGHHMDLKGNKEE